VTHPVVVLRPEPGNAATAALIEAAGLRALRMPIFEARALAWTVPDSTGYDSLLLTSAQTVRLAGAGLAALAHLPVIAVGAQTAHVARAAGLDVAIIGEQDAAEVIVRADRAGFRRLLHLAGRDRTTATKGLAHVTVYESVQVRVPDAPAGAIVLLHSPRAAHALADAPIARNDVGIVAISAATLAAAGKGWRAGRVAAAPDDAAMVAAARALAIDPLPSGGDNAA
jgi:uroporphyrinogen-III synthase